jgi:hypothetical protein
VHNLCELFSAVDVSMMMMLVAVGPQLCGCMLFLLQSVFVISRVEDMTNELFLD